MADNNVYLYENKKYQFVCYDEKPYEFNREDSCKNCCAKPDDNDCSGLNNLRSCGGGVFVRIHDSKVSVNTETEAQSQNGEVLKVSETGGKKYDGNKPRPGLLLRDCNNAIQDIISVMELGAKKYGERNWKNVENWRYDEAMLRHIIYGHIGGEILDKESHKAHLAHIACCVIFELQNLHDSKSLT